MSELIKPPVPQLATFKGQTVQEIALEAVKYHNSPRITWSYRSGTRTIMSAYKGLHNIDVLLAAADKEAVEQSRICNRTLIEHAAPVAFGRNTQVIQLKPRRFQFGRDRSAAFRVPFFFVENRIVKLYFVQPRKTDCPSLDELSMMATIHKRFLLDTEFYGQASDVEYVDLGPELKGARIPRRYSLSELSLWSETRLQDRLTLISEGLAKAEASGMLLSEKRRYVRPAEDMPLFD